MNSLRLISRRAQKVVQRTFLATVQPPSGFLAKTAREVWLGDVGSYPLLIIMGGAAMMCVGASVYFISTNPDCRIYKSSRKVFLRGEYKEDR